jgi:hypothetical protein
MFNNDPNPLFEKIRTNFIEECGFDTLQERTTKEFIEITKEGLLVPEGVYTVIGDPEKAPNKDYFGVLSYRTFEDVGLKQIILHTLSYNNSDITNLKRYFADVYYILASTQNDIIVNIINADRGRIPNALELKDLINTDHNTRFTIAKINKNHGAIVFPLRKLNVATLIDYTIKAWLIWENFRKKGPELKKNLTITEADDIPDAQKLLFNMNLNKHLEIQNQKNLNEA